VRRRSLLLVLALLAGRPAPARADWTDFLPRTLETHAWLGLQFLYESDDQQSGPRHLTWDDTLFREKLTLETAGYVYHPRFVRYRMLVSGALKQETYDKSDLPPLGRRDSSGFEYDARLFFLPEHPYTLELFATRQEPLLREEYAIQVPSVSTSYGADFRYRKKPWTFHLRASDDGIDASGLSTDVKRLLVDGRYFKSFGPGKTLAFNATYSPSRFTSSNGYTGDTQDAFLGNTLESGRFHLYSNLSETRLDQQGGLGTFQTKSRQLSWYEQFSAELPWRLRLELYWRYNENDSDYGGTAAADAQAVSSVNKNVEARLQHQLYDSLQSAYTFRWDESASTGGGTTATGNALAFNYTKSVPGPRGRLTATLNLGQGDTQSSGQNQILDELHPGVPVPGRFLLGRPDADPASVAVFVKSPVPPFELVKLTENLHYTVTGVGNTLEVTVLTLPAEFLVPATYDFRASYSLVIGNYRARTQTLGQSASLALFDSRLTPYYSFAALRSTTISGEAPGGGLNSNVFTAGASYNDGPWRALVEYGSVTWAASPWTGWKGEVQYIGPVAPMTTLNVTASYQQRHFGQSDSGEGTPPYTERATAAFGSVQKLFFSRQLSLSAGGSYSRVQGLSDSRSVGLNANLSWKTGRLEILGGANYTNTQTANGTAYAGRTIHQYYYLWLRRLLF
jgi:hypothetical protein